jgi:diacylglycerol kinase (ATP)
VSNPSVVSTQVPDLVLANPTAGGGLAQAVLPQLRKFAAEKRWNVDFRDAANPAECAQIAQEEATHGRQRIFVLGGDGTFQVLLNALAGNHQVSIGVLPAGGGNDLASALGLPLHAVRAAEAILLHGKVSYLDVARVRTADGVERLYMGGGGVGLDAAAAQFASGVYRKIPGRSRYLLSAVRALWSFHPLNVCVHTGNSEERLIECKALVLGVLNSPSYGAGLRLAPEASLQDGKLDLVVVEDLSPFEIGKVLSSLAISGKIHTRRMQRYSIRQARIEMEFPSWFHADGEIIGQTPVEVTVVPKAMRVWHLLPNPSSAVSDSREEHK